MASNYTNNYGLCQWEATDAVLRTDFNEDNQKIDTALKTQAGSISSLSSQLANKASTGTVNSLSTKLSQEIQNRQNAVAAEATAREAAVNALSLSHAADVAALRNENCWVKLSDVITSSAAASYSYTIENPAQYAEFKCIFSMESSSGWLGISLNDGTPLYEQMSAYGSSEIAVSASINQGVGGEVNVFPYRNGQTVSLQCFFSGFTDEDYFAHVEKWIGSKTVSFPQLQKITIVDQRGTILAGGRFLLYGLKK